MEPTLLQIDHHPPTDALGRQQGRPRQRLAIPGEGPPVELVVVVPESYRLFWLQWR